MPPAVLSFQSAGFTLKKRKLEEEREITVLCLENSREGF